MKPDYKISSQTDHELRHYVFARRSGLPLNYFRSAPWWKPSSDTVVFWVVVVCGVVAVIWGD